MNIKQQFKEGLITNNPVLVQLIGMCATMAITTSLFNGIGMGLSVLVILTCCNVVISLIRKVIPNDIRLAIFVLVIAGFVTIVDLLLQAYVPALSASLGVFIPLIVVNCIIIGRAEAFCQKNPVGPSFFDGIFQGLGYTLVLIAMCVIRELLGKGTFGTGIFNTIDGVIGTGNGIKIFEPEYGALVLTLPIGGFITLGCLIALMQYALRKSAEKKEAKEKPEHPPKSGSAEASAEEIGQSLKRNEKLTSKTVCNGNAVSGKQTVKISEDSFDLEISPDEIRDLQDNDDNLPGQMQFGMEEKNPEEVFEETDQEEEEFHLVSEEDENPFDDEKEEETAEDFPMDSEEDDVEKAKKVICNFGLFSGMPLGEILYKPDGPKTLRWMGSGYKGSNNEMREAAKIIMDYEDHKKIAA